MSRIVFQPAPALLGLPKLFFRQWGTSLGLWGVGAGTAALFVLSVTPVVKNKLLVHVPAVGGYFEDDTPASDKPF